MEIEVLEMKSGREMIKYFKGITVNIPLNKDFKILEILNNMSNLIKVEINGKQYQLTAKEYELTVKNQSKNTVIKVLE